MEAQKHWDPRRSLLKPGSGFLIALWDGHTKHAEGQRREFPHSSFSVVCIVQSLLGASGRHTVCHPNPKPNPNSQDLAKGHLAVDAPASQGAGASARAQGWMVTRRFIFLMGLHNRGLEQGTRCCGRPRGTWRSQEG